VFRFVKQSGGHVKIYREEGHGTSVKIYLPRSTGVQETEYEALQNVPSAGGVCPGDRRRRRRLIAGRARLVSTIQRHPDHPGQFRFAIGLCEQQHAFVEPAVMQDGVFGIA